MAALSVRLSRFSSSRETFISPPVPLTFCFETVGHLMDAVERAVHTLHVLSSALGRIGSRFFLCVTVRFSERIAARSLFTEYGEYVGAGALTTTSTPCR